MSVIKRTRVVVKDIGTNPSGLKKYRILLSTDNRIGKIVERSKKCEYGKTYKNRYYVGTKTTLEKPEGGIFDTITIEQQVSESQKVSVAEAHALLSKSVTT